MKSIVDLVESYVEVRTNRQEKEKEASELKAVEEGLKESILVEMSAQGMKSVHLEGIGRVTSRTTYHYEINDRDKLAERLFRTLIDNVTNKRPLSDGLLLQQRISKESLEASIEAEIARQGLKGTEEDYANVAENIFGVKNVGKNVLSLTKN